MLAHYQPPLFPSASSVLRLRTVPTKTFHGRRSAQDDPRFFAHQMVNARRRGRPRGVAAADAASSSGVLISNCMDTAQDDRVREERRLPRPTLDAPVRG